jgi:hypothetical protein
MLSIPEYASHSLNHVALPFHALYGVEVCSPAVVDVKFAHHDQFLPSHVACPHGPLTLRGTPPNFGGPSPTFGGPRWSLAGGCPENGLGVSAAHLGGVGIPSTGENHGSQ